MSASVSRRWAAVAVGFVGTLIIIRPGHRRGERRHRCYALGAGVALGSYFVMTRAMAGIADAMVLNLPDIGPSGGAVDAGAAVAVAVPPSAEAMGNAGRHSG